jgi:hypothetical protein
MKTFALDISKQQQEILQTFLLNLGILSIPIIYDLVVPNNLLHNNYYYFVGGFLFINLIKECFADKIFRVCFDADSHQISLYSKALFSKPKEKVIPFNLAKLEYIEEGSFLFFQGKVKLCFMKEKLEIGYIKESSRGFTKEEINEMVKIAEDKNLPATNI